MIVIVDPDVILFSFGGLFQLVNGIAITRNEAILERDWGLGWDGAMTYTEVESGVYVFVDGL